MEDIRVEYRNQPNDLIDDFRDLGNHFGVTINCNETSIDYYEGGAPDIVIFFSQQLGGLLSTGILLPAVYDLIKGTILSCWKKLITYNSQKRKSKYDPDKNLIELNVTIAPDKTVTFSLEGNVDYKSVDMVLDKVFNHLRHMDQLASDFQNPDYNDNDPNPKLRFRFNQKTKEWEPLNYSELRKRNEKLRDKIRKLKS